MRSILAAASALALLSTAAAANPPTVIATFGLGAGGTAELADAPYTSGFDALLYMVIGPNAGPVGVIEYHLPAFNPSIWPQCSYGAENGHVGNWLDYSFALSNGGSAGVDDPNNQYVTNQVQYRTTPPLAPGDYFINVHCR